MSRFKKARAYMLANYSDCIDPKTDLINHTLLAENTSDALAIYLKDESTPEWLYELAIEVGKQLEKNGLCAKDSI